MNKFTYTNRELLCLTQGVQITEDVLYCVCLNKLSLVYSNVCSSCYVMKRQASLSMWISRPASRSRTQARSTGISHGPAIPAPLGQ